MYYLRQNFVKSVFSTVFLLIFLILVFKMCFFELFTYTQINFTLKISLILIIYFFVD